MKLEDIMFVTSVVKELNANIDSVNGGSITPFVIMETNGEDFTVKYLGDCIFDSVDEGLADGDEFLPELKEHLRKEINAINECIGEIKI